MRTGLQSVHNDSHAVVDEADRCQIGVCQAPLFAMPDDLGMSWSNNRIQRAVQGRTVNGMDPMKQTKKANIPILVYHGDRDVRVPL